MRNVAVTHPPVDLRWAERIPALVLLAALLGMGFWPKSVSDPINAALAGLKFSERTTVVKVVSGTAVAP